MPASPASTRVAARRSVPSVGWWRCGAAFVALPIALLAGCAVGPLSVAHGSVITVDDPDHRGEVGDGRLSLSEALALARGSIAPDALGAAERARVEGTPGAASRDLIRFVPDLRIGLRRQPEPVSSILPALTGPGDEIDGSGATIDGSQLGGEPQAGPLEVLWITDTEYGVRSVAALLPISASGARVHDLTVESVPGAAFVVAGAPGDGVADVALSRNTVRGLGRDSFSDGIIVIGSSNVDDGSLRDVAVLDNVLSDVHAGVVVIAGGAIGAGRAVRGGRLERVTVARNRIERPITAITALAGQALLDAVTEDDVLADLAITANVVDAPLDVGILVSTTQPFAAGSTARNRIVRARIAANTITAPAELARGNTALFVTGGQVFAGGTSRDDVLEDLLVEDNVVEGVATGLLLVAGDAERCGPCETARSTVQRVVSRRNVWRSRVTGLLVAAGASFESAGTVAENRLRDVAFEDEDVEAGRVGIVIDGGLATSLPLGGDFLASGIRFPGYREPGSVGASRVTDLAVRRSRVRAGDGIVVQGGSVTATEDAVHGSGIERLVLEDDVVAAERTGIVVVGGVVVGSGDVASCEVLSVTEIGNTTDAGAPLRAIVVQQAASGDAPQGSVRDNRVVP